MVPLRGTGRRRSISTSLEGQRQGWDLFQMPHEILEFWGKARASDSGEQQFHPLAFHMLDVAACAEQVIAAWPERFERLANGIGASRSDLQLTAIRLVALHDIGKCARGFQAKVLGLWPSALGPRPKENSVASVRHDAAGLWLFANSPLLRDVAKALLPGCPSGDRIKILQAVCGHHGEPVSLGDIREECFYLRPLGGQAGGIGT